MPMRYWPSSARSSIPHAAISCASRWVVEIGRPVRLAISVSEYTLPSANVSRIAMTLLVTDRPASAELPDIDAPFDRLEPTVTQRRVERRVRVATERELPAKSPPT